MFKNQKVDRVRKVSGKSRKLEELILPNAKLRFCPEQLQNLNFLFQNKLQQYIAECSEKSIILARSVTERLIQRLLCAVGNLDPRFASKYLISVNGPKSSNIVSKNMEYLMRLDCLSTPPLYKCDSVPRYSVTETDADYPPAYARVRLQTSTFKLWGEFANSSGYLRRDKVQARLVELLATAAAQDTPNSPLHVDESVLCGIPGKVVDAATLHYILNTKPEHHVYYGPGGNVPRFPDPRDFRLAIVDEPGGIRIRVEFLSPALANISINVRLLVAIGIDAWPASTDFPARVSLGHTDCLLYHQAAQTGMYLVGYGVQSSAWQIRVPAAEYVLLNHYGPNSTVKTILDVLYYVIEDIDSFRSSKKQQVSYKILNRYTMLTALLQELEDNSIDALTDILNWSPLYLSCHVLKILDKIISHLRSQRQQNYFFHKSNLFVNPGHLCEDDFCIEANNVKSFILRVFDESLTSTSGNKDFEKMITAQESEMALLHKWKDLIDGLLPPPGTRGRRFCFAGSRNRLDIAHTQYTVRQLEYIGMLLKNMLCVKQYILQENEAPLNDLMKSEHLVHESHLEDVIFILVNVMDQACDQYLRMQTNPTIEKNRPKIKNQYHTKTSKLVEIIRKDKEMININFGNDLLLVKVILKWLYKAMDHNKKNLGPILRPYLNHLFTTSHAISWHLETIKQKASKDEIEALGIFAKLVNTGSITPAHGLIDAVNKNWMWAKHMLSMVEKNTLRVVFVSDRGKFYRHILSLPSYQRKTTGENGIKTLNCSRERSEIRRQITLPNRSYFNSLLKARSSGTDDELTPQHEILKNYSPLNLIFDSQHRKGEHRGCGDIFKALLSMHKINMFQEVTSTLPKEDRKEILEMIHHMQNTKARRAAGRKWSNTLPQKNKCTLKSETYQKYTPKEESAGIKIETTTTTKAVDIIATIETRSNTLIGKCRAARIREDSNVFLVQDNLKIRTLLNKSESFKY